MNSTATIIDAPKSLADSYAYCRRVTRRAGSSFYYPLWLLPNPKRQGMYALYAFCRIADDIGDGSGASDARREKLDVYREAIEGDGTARNIPAELPALFDTLRRFHVPKRRLLEILDGVAMDLEPRRYANWADLQVYCYHVAGAVGLACLAIWGADVPEAQFAAVRCGEAFQLTNILRDVREDAQRGRVYLPQDELAECGCDERDLIATEPAERWLRLIRRETERARAAFADAAVLKRWLPPDSRAVYDAMWRTYRLLLTEIEKRRGDVFSRRIRLGRAQRLCVVASAWRTRLFPEVERP